MGRGVQSTFRTIFFQLFTAHFVQKVVKILDKSPQNDYSLTIQIRRKVVCAMNAKGDANRSVRQTKQRLYEALVHLLQQKSLREITVRELTELAGISRGTFYFHYADIYALMEQMEVCPIGAAGKPDGQPDPQHQPGGCSPRADRAVQLHERQPRSLPCASTAKTGSRTLPATPRS